ncbi:MAG TPA: hypothetical protein VKO43_07295 [Candidatus Krumholzibacteriaceae bacterium]|nr:hypothetical protein [Candidatus Krumholzibacteriaceae bacterium]
MLNKSIFSTLLILPVIFALIFSTGCSSYKPRPIDITKGEYYEEEGEYQKLSDEDREEYCRKLSDELQRLQGNLEENKDQLAENRDNIENMKKQLREKRSRYSRLNVKFEEYTKQLQQLVSLPKKWELEYGECLWTLASYEEIYGDPLKWTRIWRQNFDLIEDPNWVLAGWTLDIPREWPRKHVVAKDEWLAKIAGYWEIYDNYRKWPVIYEANRDKIENPDLIFPDQEFVIPREEPSIE